MIATLLYISGLAFAAFMGAIVGAGLMKVAYKDSDVKRDADRLAERETVAKLCEAAWTTHVDVSELIQQAVALSACNAEILRYLQQASLAGALAAATTGRPN